ncbi:MAG: hypothetical protein KME33_00745 [Aetokthonos hydrillicola CCALA 1050]|nr:hypothetical protein [Aetokthonos hydrillicola CCALA 1050]
MVLDLGMGHGAWGMVHGAWGIGKFIKFFPCFPCSPCPMPYALCSSALL